ncbi:diaminopimelate epimerase [Arcobacter sp. FWKO B]|uniref:diaminopimelate epimerase n=1 Tax=Arcobacter sp. FWKO B TaxID=2593672 RepID=UPI0018A5B54E|nr:diaminopimelate epimerase [Arcobacter sp. FWKO B]QOG12137.1 diaminopimelate epimerase [Arcobacter sp. FWKO B]
MTLQKYSASGNDFLIFHTFIKKDYSELAKKYCDRYNGIGADGLIVLVPIFPDTKFPETKEGDKKVDIKNVDFEWLFYNSDGSTAAMCGNGARACALYAYNNGLSKNSIKFLTGAGIIECYVSYDIVEIALTKPTEIKEPFSEEGYEWWMVDTGVPHLVTFVDDLDKFNIDIARKLRKKHNSNVNFAKLENGKLYVRTYERGVEAETQACGTGMAACFLRAYNLGLVQDVTRVYPKSGELLTMTMKNGILHFKGPVKKLFSVNI